MNTNQSPITQAPIQYQLGRKLHFVATRPFALGQTGLTVKAGTDILFDGTNAEVDGSEYKLPMLRGAVKAGWLVLADEYQEDSPLYAHRDRANIQVRPTNGGNPLNPQPRTAIATTESDEREVGNTKDHASKTATANKGYVRGQTTVNGFKTGQVVQTQRGMMTVEEQDGIEVDRKLMTPAGERSKERLDLTTDRAATALRVAQNAQVQPGKGITEQDMLARMTPEAQADYLARKEALRSQYVADAPVAATPALPRPSARQVVARVQSASHSQAEGFSTKNTVGGGVHVGDQTDGDVVGRVHETDDVEVVESEGIKFTTTNGARSPKARKPAEATTRQVPSAEVPPPVPPNLDVRRRIAKAVCPDFPENYDFTLSPKKKLARLEADYSDRLDVLRAVYAAESDDMKAMLLQEFPHAFSA